MRLKNIMNPSKPPLYTTTLSKLTHDHKISCEALPSEMECLESLKTMEMGKSYGADGLPAEVWFVNLL